ncbi:MAG: TonB-dependent receptor [Acidobacteria bacterium]|nr:TonB-dependent receptor [Acidobacteriota bacterium]
MRLRRSIPILTGALAVLSMPGAASAQVLYGSIVGNVADATGGSVPDATVSITQEATGLRRQTTTNLAGVFQFPTVPGGAYEVQVSKPGFTTFVRRDVAVAVNAVTRVDAVLQVSAVAEQVQVSASASALQTERAEVRAEVSAKVLENVPLPPGRNYLQVLRTIPGFTPPRNGNGPSVDPSRTPIYNVNGTSRSSNNIRIEGAGVNQIWLPHNPGYTPALESIENVNVVTNSFDAEHGLAGGAAVNVQIKSGTNELHGSAFWFHNNNRTKAKPFFQPAGERNPKAIFNQFGGTVGGPIVRSRLFYFASYEGTYDRQFASRLATVPTAAIRRGDMSASTRPVYDPTSGDASGAGRAPFAENIVPSSRFEPIALNIMSFLPQPTFPDSLSANLFAGGPFQLDQHKIDAKLTWNATDKFTMFGRGGIVDHSMFSTGMLGELVGDSVSAAAVAAGPAFGTTGNAAVGVTYVFTPQFIVDGNFGYTAYDANSEEPGLGKNMGRDVLGIPGTNGTRHFESGWPRFNVSNYTIMGASRNSSRPFYNRDPRFQYVANANWIRGGHNLRFGADIARQHLNHTQAEFVGAMHGPSGGFTFAGGPTTTRGGPAPNQFNSFAAFLLGLPTGIGKTFQVPEEYTLRGSLQSLYVRDQWQVSRRVSFSLGLRWEYFPVPRRVDRGIENYDPNLNKMRVCGVGVVPLDCGVEESKRLFAPRMGIAWRATDTFVVRAGYGITNDPYSLIRPMRTNYPLLVVLNLTGPNALQPAGLLRNGIPAVTAPDLGDGIIDIAGTYAANVLEEKFRRGYIQSWNFTLQKQLGWGFTGQAGYVATRQINQLGFRELNAGRPGGGNPSRPLNQRFRRTAETRLVAPVGNTHYDSLQTSLERRFSQGLHLAVSYTWSKSTGICCNDHSDGLPAIHLPEFYHLNRSVSGFDTPHNFEIVSVAELPFGRGKHWLNQGGLASALAGGWQLNALFSASSGTPFNVTSSGTSLDAPGNTQRADLVKSKVEIPGGAGRGQSYFDPFAFIPVTEPRFGTAGFRILRGPGLVNLDLGVFREFPLGERLRMQFRADAFNLTNTPHFANPGANVSNLQLNPDGTIRSLGGYTEITGIANTGRDGIDERVFRFGLRFSF